LHHIRTGVDHATSTMPFDPSEAFHEYRFDWYTNRVDYYVDGKQYATLTNQVPDRPSRRLPLAPSRPTSEYCCSNG
jgi:beta-glucanase (GH16 family)